MSSGLFTSEGDQDERNSSNDKAVSRLILFIFALPFIPAALIGMLFYWLFLRVLKLRRSVSGAIALAVVFLSYGALTVFDGINRAVEAFTAPGGFVENWSLLLYALIPLSFALGALIGYGIILWDVRDIHNNPHRVELPGFWTYKLRWRKTPLEVWRKRRALAALRAGTLVEEDRAPLGYDEEKDQVAYRFTEESVRHTLVTGAAGSGKTISMLTMMRADIEAGRTVIAVDFKRSPEFAAKLAAWAREFDAPFYHFEKGKPESYRIEHSLGQSTYDPFASGSGSEMILNMREYDTASAVYKGHMQQLLQVIFAMMEQADRNKRRDNGTLVVANIDWDHGGIYQLASVLTDPNLKDLLEACEGKPIFLEAQDYIPKAISGKGMENHSLEELRGQMRTIVASAYGRWFKIGDGSRNIDLLKMMTGKQAIALFSFNSEDEPELSRYVGSMIFADMRACSSHIRNRSAEKITNVYVDEFQAVPPTAVNGLLEKARESQIAMTLAQQAFEQIITSSPANGEAYLQSILVTCSNFLTHAGMTQDSAERISKLMGKHWKAVYSRTNRSDGGFLKNNFGNRRNQIVSASNQEIWKVEPSEFMALSAPTGANGYRSTAILVNKAVADPEVEADGTIARKLWMVPPAVVLEKYVTPYIGDEENEQAQNLYADSSVNLLTAEEQVELQRSYDENTPIYRDDQEVIRGNGATPSYATSEPLAEADFIFAEEEAFEDFGVDYDSEDDEYDDGSFGIEELDPIEAEPTNPRRSLDDNLAAFDDAVAVRRINARPTAPRRPQRAQPTPAPEPQPLPQRPQVQRVEPRRPAPVQRAKTQGLLAQNFDEPPRLGRSVQPRPRVDRNYEEEEGLPDI